MLSFILSEYNMELAQIILWLLVQFAQFWFSCRKFNFPCLELTEPFWMEAAGKASWVT